MCTAASYRTKDLYFGRNLDYEFSYGDEVTITPRNYPFTFRRAGEMRTHYAMIGMAYVAEEYPLYYDAVNEKGLCIAGLNFVGNAACQSETDGKDNISVFELIPWLLGQCADLNEVRALLAKLNLVDIPFNAQLPTAKLHWLITDRTGSITVEAMADGLHVYENPVEVLTNNPPFPQQMAMLANYRALSPRTPKNTFAPGVDLPELSRGMGGIGLPGIGEQLSGALRASSGEEGGDGLPQRIQPCAGGGADHTQMGKAAPQLLRRESQGAVGLVDQADDPGGAGGLGHGGLILGGEGGGAVQH